MKTEGRQRPTRQWTDHILKWWYERYWWCDEANNGLNCMGKMCSTGQLQALIARHKKKI